MRSRHERLKFNAIGGGADARQRATRASSRSERREMRALLRGDMRRARRPKSAATFTRYGASHRFQRLRAMRRSSLMLFFTYLPIRMPLRA